MRFSAILLILILCPFYLLAIPLSVMTENFPPFNFKKDNQIQGFSTELVREVMKEVNQPDNIQLLPWSRAYRQVKDADNQVLFSVYRKPAREDLFKWVGPLFEANVVFFSKKGSGVKINNLDDARKVKKIAIQKDSAHHGFLKDRNFTNLDVVAQAKKVVGNSNLDKLLRGRVDLWMATEISGREKAKILGYDVSQLETAFIIRRNFLYIAFSKNTPDHIINQWQKALDQLKENGFYQKLRGKYSI